MDPSDLRRAYAVLSLSPPVTEDRLKRRYKTLVRRWHPDRYESDPAGQTEATARLRNINLAYELVTVSLDAAAPLQQEEFVPPRYPTPTYQTERSSPWSAERVEAIVDSINEQNSWSLVPTMSVHRWSSIGATAAYLLLTGVVLPVFGHLDAIVLVFPGVIYSLIPLYLIWKGDDESLTNIQQSFFHVVGWAFMAVPAIIGLLLWITGSITL